MKASVFTPLTAAGNPYVGETYRSLCEQTVQDWEWLVLENNGGKLDPAIARDPRVHVASVPACSGVGEAKSVACSLCTGDVLLELDHDDLLAPDAINRVMLQFELGADFVYSDFAEFKSDTWAPNAYSTYWGWQSYDVTFGGHGLRAMRAPDHTPQNLRRIEWAPNHLRAWRRTVYEALGGHDAGLRFADDHDLVLRTYLAGYKLVGIPECLYAYRVHAEQNVQRNNGVIQELESEVYDRYIYQLATRFADQAGLRKIDLCGGINTARGFHALDRSVPSGYGTECDLEQRWPLEDSSVGVLRAFDAIEHLRDPIATMNEAYRVLAPGGFMLVMVPSTDAMLEELDEGRVRLINGSGAYCDPTHVSFWNALSFRYYTDDRFRRYVPAVHARFQVARCRTINVGGIPYVQAELIALKDGYSPMGEVRC